MSYRLKPHQSGFGSDSSCVHQLLSITYDYTSTSSEGFAPNDQMICKYHHNDIYKSFGANASLEIELFY